MASVGDLYLVDRDRPGAVGSGGMACLQAIQSGRWRVEAGERGCERLNGSDDYYQRYSCRHRGIDHLSNDLQRQIRARGLRRLQLRGNLCRGEDPAEEI